MEAAAGADAAAGPAEAAAAEAGAASKGFVRKIPGRAAEQAGKQAAEKAAQQAGKEAAEQAGKQAAEEAAQQAGKETAQQAGKQAAEEAAQQAGKETASTQPRRLRRRPGSRQPRQQRPSARRVQSVNSPEGTVEQKIDAARELKQRGVANRTGRSLKPLTGTRHDCQGCQLRAEERT